MRRSLGGSAPGVSEWVKIRLDDDMSCPPITHIKHHSAVERAAARRRQSALLLV